MQSHNPDKMHIFLSIDVLITFHSEDNPYFFSKIKKLIIFITGLLIVNGGLFFFLISFNYS